jgi:hypothetical protein
MEQYPSYGNSYGTYENYPSRQNQQTTQVQKTTSKKKFNLTKSQKIAIGVLVITFIALGFVIAAVLGAFNTDPPEGSLVATVTAPNLAIVTISIWG